MDRINKIAKDVIAGKFEAPPALVKSIGDWAKSAGLAYDIWYAEDFLEDDIADIERAEARVQNKKDNDKFQDEDWKRNIKMYEDRIERTRGHVAESEKRIADMKKEAKQFRKIKPRPWKTIRKVFKVDLTGWKYKKLYDDAEQSRKDWADETYGEFAVTLKRGRMQAKNAIGVWNSNKGTMIVKLGNRTRETIRHELQHWAQSYLGIVTGKKIGLPPKKMRNPEISQHGVSYFNSPERAKGKYFDNKVIKRWEREKYKELKNMGIGKSDLHDLDDVEFHTEMSGITESLERKLNEKELSKQDRRDTLYKFIANHNQLMRLKRFSKAKWFKMVKEIIKEIL